MFKAQTPVPERQRSRRQMANRNSMQVTTFRGHGVEQKVSELVNDTVNIVLRYLYHHPPVADVMPKFKKNRSLFYYCEFFQRMNGIVLSTSFLRLIFRFEQLKCRSNACEHSSEIVSDLLLRISLEITISFYRYFYCPLCGDTGLNTSSLAINLKYARERRIACML